MHSPRRLIESLIADPSVDLLHRQQLNACCQELQAQGLQTSQGLAAQTVDTQVGFMRRLGATFNDPMTNASMELLVYLLAKVDGTVQCWSELWGISEPAVPELVTRHVSLGTSAQQVAIPRRLRLARTNLFEMRLARKQLADASALVGHLQAKGVLPSSHAVNPEFAQQVSAALSA
jgi:hypothetical protein